jgi:hypothetical protein
VLDDAELDHLAVACATLPPAAGNYLMDDFVTNLLATVVDFQTQTPVVERALAHYRQHRWAEVRDLSDLKALFARWPPTQEGNTALAVYLWGYRLWTRAAMLRGLVVFLESVGVTDQESLRQWATTSSYEDFKGQVRGLGPAVYQWLVMRQGVDTVKPDVHVHRFVAGAIGRSVTDAEIIVALPVVAARLRVSSHALDWSHLGDPTRPTGRQVWRRGASLDATTTSRGFRRQ